jgi:CheY-like chemotaxis protein
MSEAVRILIVDDDPDLRFLARCLIETEFDGRPLTIIEAGGGREALDYCTNETFDVVVLDMHMPEMSGLAVLSDLRSLAVRPCVVAWSADRAALRQAEDHGVFAVVEKGDDGADLVGAVSECLDAHAA